MDNVTHALAGGLLAAASIALVERRTGRPASPGFGRAAAILGVVAAELPDADLVYAGSALGMGKLGHYHTDREHGATEGGRGFAVASFDDVAGGGGEERSGERVSDVVHAPRISSRERDG